MTRFFLYQNFSKSFLLSCTIFRHLQIVNQAFQSNGRNFLHISVIVKNFPINVFFHCQSLHIDLLHLIKLVLLFLFNILINHIVYFSLVHIIFFYFLSDFVKDRLVLDGDSQQCLLELLEVHPNIELLSNLFPDCDCTENSQHFLRVDYERIQLEGLSKEIPSLKDNFMVVLSLRQRKIGVLDQKFIRSFEI